MSHESPLASLEAVDARTGNVNVIIDTPRGSRNKYKYDEKRGLFKLGKRLPLGASFPFDFGFIPSTRGEDGDPLDVLVLMDEPAFPGCVVPVRLLGVIEAEQTEKGKTVRNDRLIATLDTPFNPPEVRSLDDLSDQRLQELEHFFISYNAQEGRQFKPTGRHGAARAMRLLEEGKKTFAENGKPRKR